MTFETLQTERLILEKLGAEEYRVLFETSTDEDIMRLLHLSDAEELANEKEKYRKGLSTHNKTFLNFRILDKASGQAIGACGFHTWYTDHHRAEIGYAMKDDHHKAKGIMSEAMRAILRYGFEQMQLNRIEAFIGPGNTASLKLVAKFGFVKEGHLRSHYFKKGVMEDSFVFGLLKQEYDPYK